VGCDTFDLKFWVKPRLSENGDFQPIFPRSASAVTLSEKSSINTTRKSTTRFSMSEIRWTSYAAHMPPPKGAPQNGRFPYKIALRLKKVCYKVSLCENCQRQSCKAFICLSIRAKMIGGGRPLLRENLADTHPPPRKTPIFNLFSLVSPKPWHLAKKVQLTLIGSPLCAFQWV